MFVVYCGNEALNQLTQIVYAKNGREFLVMLWAENKLIVTLLCQMYRLIKHLHIRFWFLFRNWVIFLKLQSWLDSITEVSAKRHGARQVSGPQPLQPPASSLHSLWPQPQPPVNFIQYHAPSTFLRSIHSDTDLPNFYFLSSPWWDEPAQFAGVNICAKNNYVQLQNYIVSSLRKAFKMKQ